MPDLMSHLIIGLLLAEVFNIRKKSLIVLGALAPDILSKIPLIFFYFGTASPVSFVPFHTPFMWLLLSILLAPLFRYDKLKTVLFFNIGSISHFLSDLTMKHFDIVGTRLFFPFSNANYTLNWIWPEQSIYILIVSLFVYMAVRVINKSIRYKKSANT
ncbi:hypothetical protein KY347_02375 [Candidatus Woesearchaeota archaeon]|nr:hypothetical protein [Candidatus Woesearchaeota archaeon]